MISSDFGPFVPNWNNLYSGDELLTMHPSHMPIQRDSSAQNGTFRPLPTYWKCCDKGEHSLHRLAHSTGVSVMLSE